MVRSDSKNWRREVSAQVFDVREFTIEYDPGNSGCGCSPCDLRECRRPHRLKNNSVRALVFAGLHECENLLALLNAIAISIEDLQAHAQFSGGLLSSNSLLYLVIVVLSDQGDYDSEFVHSCLLSSPTDHSSVSEK